MASFNNIVFTASEYLIGIILENAKTLALGTVQDFGYNVTRDQSDSHALGQQEPIATKRNGVAYTGSFSLQFGEYIKLCDTAGVVEGTEITNAQITMTTNGGLAGATNKVITFKEVNLNTTDFSVKAKDTESVIKIDFKCVAIDMVTV